MTDHAVLLPALDGTDPLGFLAALGTLRLIPDSRLSFDTASSRAVVHSGCESTEKIAEVLRGIVDQISEGAYLPECPPDFPPAGGNSGTDPLRPPRADYRALARTYHETPAARTWLHAVTTDLAARKKDQACEISPYMAPAGKQRVYTFFAKPLELIRKQPDYLHQALTDWKRHEGYSGEYFDHRAIVNAAASPTGEAQNLGVPGASWLACMALTLLRTTGTGESKLGTGWHYHRTQRRSFLIWPLWNRPLGPEAAKVLIEHALLRPDHDDKHTLRIPQSPALLKQIGIFTVAAAVRQPTHENQSAGALAPTPITIGRSSLQPTTATIL